MSKFSLPLTKLIHENLSLLMTFCFSRQALRELVETKFHGEWKYLRKALFSMSEERATKACIELAVFLRLLDDQENISAFGIQCFGRLFMQDESEKVLRMRDVANKIIHASDLKWDFSAPQSPVLVCRSQETEKWVRAEVDVVSLAAFCGGLMS